MNEDRSSLLSIGEFARRSRLAVSALRFYGECGLLVPARIDSGTGYRYYSEDQLQEAALVRALRALEMPITEIQTILAADPLVADDLLGNHWKRLQARFHLGRQALGEARALLRSKEKTMTATATLHGAELAAGVRQVLPAAGPLHGIEEYPAAMLIEVREDGVRLAATDGHRLAVRDLPGRTQETGRTVVGMADAARLAARVEDAGPVTVECGGDLSIRLDGEADRFAAASDHYPDHEAILGRCGHGRLLVKTADVLNRLDPSREVGVLNLTEDRVTLDSSDFPGRYEGDDLIIGFNPSYLAEGLAAGIGPDAIFQLGGPLDPVALRSADHGTLTWLVMPMRLREAAPA